MLTRFAISCLLILTACSNKTECWKHHEIITSKLKYNSQRIYHPTEDFFCGLEFEIIRDICTCRGYINLFTGSAQPETDNYLYSQVSLTIDENEHTFLARRFEGGQRLLLPRDETLLIIGTLLSGKSCKLELLDGYTATLVPSNFSDSWHSKPPLVPYPKIF